MGTLNLLMIIRNFRKNKTTTLIKILGLAVSMSAVIIIWAYVINENKFDKGIPGSDRIFRLEAQWASMPPFLGHALNQNLSDQIPATRLNFWGDVGIQVENNPFNIKDLAFADSTFFKVFALDFITGDRQTALASPFSLVLTESVAKKLFGTIDVAGKIVRFQDQFDFTVTAVIKDQPYLHFRFDALVSMTSLELIRYKGVLQEYDGWSYPTYMIFPDGARKAENEKTVLDLIKKVGYREQFRLRSFNDIYFLKEVENESNTKHGNLLYNRILIAVSIFILLLAAINFINLTIANAVSRSKEISLKKVMGSSIVQLVGQFVLETVFYILVSNVLAIVILWFLNPLLQSMAGFAVSIAEFWNPVNLLIYISGILVFILLSGTYPGIYISSYDIFSKSHRSIGDTRHVLVRNGLIIFQNLVSITLICCTLIANRQFRFMNKTDLGFNKEDVVILKINSQLAGHLDLFKEKLSSYPEIESISFSSRIPGTYWGSWCCVNIEGRENKYFNNYVDHDYLKTLGISLKDGRNFSGENPGDKKMTYLINETAIKLYDLKNPIGQMITPGNGVKGQIIGIINDFHYRGLNYEKSPLLLFYTPEYLNYINIRTNRQNMARALEVIQNVWKEMSPAFAFEYRFLDDTYELQYKSEKRFENLLFYFALLAIFIASIGLFGLSIYSTARRIKEIGIRKVNGAGGGEIIYMLNKDIIKWVAIAFIIACPLAAFTMHKWLLVFAYRTEMNVWIFALAGLVSLCIALLTVSVQSWRAATRNPVEALRYE